MDAQIISIGDEILQGQTLNTNANFLSQKLTNLSFVVKKICTIGDTRTAIINSLDNSIGKVNLVIVTGGLGPTSDDITKKVLAEYFDGELVENSEVLEDVKNFVEARGFELNDLNRKQALVPTTCEVIRNPIGTAPTMLFEKNNTILISMPGVPFEMQQIFDEKVIPTLKKQLEFPTSCIKFVHTLGLPEAMLSAKLSEFENELPNNINLAFLPSPEGIKIKLSSFGGHQGRLCENIKEQISKLEKIIGDNIFGYENDTLEKVLAKALIDNKKTISTAESCTGGLVGHKLISIPGSSEYFCGGVVSYSNNAKIKTLEVNEKTIEKFGAVSKETVIEMAKGTLKLFNTDYAIAVSGIAGPDGGTDEKPVGTTWIAIGSKDDIRAYIFKFGTRRDINVRRAVATAMHLLLNFIKKTS